ncbi:MAG: hypothetical protein EXS41_00315 [Opitutaceae bacterium]|nr:hypothetical protein [Opitutaceae bacterium]
MDQSPASGRQHWTRRDLLKLALVGTAVPFMAEGSAKPGESPPAESDDSRMLARRAAHFRELILNGAMGPGGMIISWLRFDTRRPFQEGEPVPDHFVETLDRVWGPASPRPTPAEWLYGENTLWATGWFLYSQILRYRATGEPEARQTAQKCFRDLNNIFRLCRSIDPGLLAKPHGGRAGATTSPDQSACPVIFYAMYARELATPEEKAQAVENMNLHGELYIRRNWEMNHFGNLLKVVDIDPANFSIWINGPPTTTMKYLACEYAAYQLTGETKFRDEALKHMRKLIRSGFLPWPFNPYPTIHNLYYWAMLCDFWSKTELAAEFDWAGCIREYWQAARASLDVDGLARLGDYDTKKQSFAPYTSVWLPAERQKSPAVRQWRSATLYNGRPLGSAFAAALGLLARSHGLDDSAHVVARKILTRMDEDTLRLWWGRDEKFPEELKPMLNVFAPEVAGAWQIAYWMGRSQQVW